MKAIGTYASLVKGVSQQAPADRLEGQHGEVLNMLSDPVRGLVRRNGSVIEDQVLAATTGAVDDASRDSFSFRVFSYKADGNEVDLIYRSRPKIGSGPNHLAGLIPYLKSGTDPGFIELVIDAGDVTALDEFANGGLGSPVALGSYVVMAGNTSLPAYGLVDQMTGQDWSDSGVAWVRGGAYGRTYKITATKASTDTEYTAEYTTMVAAYPDDSVGADIAALDYTDTDYQKQVNDLNFAYQAAVNKWIADASADIVPSNIAQKLIDALTTAGFTGWVRNGSHIGHDDVSRIEVNDGGDGSLLVAVMTITAAADEVTDLHYVGKVVKVQPTAGSDEVFYLKAYDRDGGDTTGLRPVIWREAAGSIQTPTNMFAIGTLYAGKFYAASTPSILKDLIEDETGDVLDVPQFVPSTVGDTDSCTPPHFYGKQVTALTVFQDRLVVWSGSTANMSRPGDYFNFYRSSVLTVPDDDPIEVYALGTEGDTIRQAGVYDRNLIAFGDAYHYLMDGRKVATPTTAALSIQFTIAQSAGARPATTGNMLFLLKEDTHLGSCRLMQTQLGAFQDSPQLADVSRQLRDYLNGTPAEVVALGHPETVFVRTEHFLKSQTAFPRARPWGLYVYQYMDAPDGKRMVDAWSAWEWSTALGTPIGIAPTVSGDGLLIYTLAWGKNESGVSTRAVIAMSVSARPDPTGRPYLDGQRPATDAATSGLLTTGAPANVRAVTFTAAGALHSYEPVLNTTDQGRFAGLTHPQYTVGDGPPEDVDPNRWAGVQGNKADYINAFPYSFTDDLWTGVAFPAYVDITPPFIRDQDGKAKEGTLTLNRLHVTLMRTAGFVAQYIDHDGTKTLQDWGNTFERIKYHVTVWVGRSTEHVQVRLGAKTWLPLTINSIKWTGQFFGPKQ